MRGEITIGDFREEFESVIGFWSPRDYEAQWLRGARRAAVEGKSSCLITSLTDPSHAEYLRLWLIYPSERIVTFQEALLLLSDLKVPFSTADPYRSIPLPECVADGRPVSEWELPRKDLKEFVTEQSAP